MDKTKVIRGMVLMVVSILTYLCPPLWVASILTRFDFAYAYWWAFGGFYGGMIFLGVVMGGSEDSVEEVVKFYYTVMFLLCVISEVTLLFR